jgi:cyclin A
MRGYRGYEDNGTDDMDALLCDIYAAMIQRTPPGHAPQPVAAGADLGLDAVLGGIRSIRIPTVGFAAGPRTVDSAVSTPTTPSASLPAPFSYGDAATEDTDDSIASTTITIQNSLKK